VFVQEREGVLQLAFFDGCASSQPHWIHSSMNTQAIKETLENETIISGKRFFLLCVLIGNLLKKKDNYLIFFLPAQVYTKKDS
jgi:hypothetical protein